MTCLSSQTPHLPSPPPLWGKNPFCSQPRVWRRGQGGGSLLRPLRRPEWLQRRLGLPGDRCPLGPRGLAPDDVPSVPAPSESHTGQQGLVPASQGCVPTWPWPQKRRTPRLGNYMVFTLLFLKALETSNLGDQGGWVNVFPKFSQSGALSWQGSQSNCETEMPRQARSAILLLRW